MLPLGAHDKFLRAKFAEIDLREKRGGGRPLAHNDRPFRRLRASGPHFELSAGDLIQCSDQFPHRLKLRFGCVGLLDDDALRAAMIGNNKLSPKRRAEPGQRQTQQGLYSRH